MNALQAVGGGHLGFFNFEALLHIFQLGIQQIWIQHPSIVQKACVPKINTICLQHFKYAHFPEFCLVYDWLVESQDVAKCKQLMPRWLVRGGTDGHCRQFYPILIQPSQ